MVACESGAAFCAFLIGMLVLCFSLQYLDWNERHYVCENWEILSVQKEAQVLNCDQEAPIGAVVFFSCPLQNESLKEWTPEKLGFAELGDSIKFTSVMAQANSWMLQCVEQAEGDSTPSYSLEWRDSFVDSSDFNRSAPAIERQKQVCGHSFDKNPWWFPSWQGVHRAGTVKAGHLTLQPSLVRGDEAWGTGLSVDKHRPVPLDPFASSFSGPETNSPLEGYPDLSTRSMYVVGDELHTCDVKNLAVGCMKVQFYQNWDRKVSAITSVGPGQLTLPVHVEIPQRCLDKDMEIVGSKFEALLEGEMGESEFFAWLQQENAWTTWSSRFFGLFWAWLGVMCIMAPFQAMVHGLGIPFCHHCVDASVGKMECCIASTGGIGLGLITIAAAWMEMRPVRSAIISGICMLCFGAVVASSCYKLNRQQRSWVRDGSEGQRVPLSEDSDV